MMDLYLRIIIGLFNVFLFKKCLKKHEGGMDVSKCGEIFFPFLESSRWYLKEKFHGRISFSSKRDSRQERYTTS